jgi:hypothetical protein
VLFALLPGTGLRIGAIVLVSACRRTLTAFSQGDWPLTYANAADARSETDFFRKAFFIAREFPSDDASRAPHRDSKAMGQLGGGSPQLQLSASYAHRPAQPSPARAYLSHTSTPNCRWQNRECCQQVPISPAVIFRHCRSRGIQRESPSNLTNGQETGKMFQRKMFHVLTVFFSPRSAFLARPRQ